MTQEQIRECSIIIHYFTTYVTIGRANYDPDDELFELFGEKHIINRMAIALADAFGINIFGDAGKHVRQQCEHAANIALSLALDKGVQRRTLGAIAQASINCGTGDAVAAAMSASLIETAGWILADKIADIANSQ